MGDMKCDVNKEYSSYGDGINGIIKRTVYKYHCLKDQTIYEIPTNAPRSTSPDVAKSRKMDFEKLLKNFENGFSSKEMSIEKPAMEPIAEKSFVDKSIIEKSIKLNPMLTAIKVSKSTENIIDVGKYLKRDRKFLTETKRYRNHSDMGCGVGPKKENPQLDVDKENLNRLMIEIYETVTAACNMEGAGNKPGSFPTDQSDGSTSEDSIKLTRSLTEKRKNYVRRVSSRVAYLDTKSIRQTRFRHQTSICSYKSEIIDNPYSTFRSWKSFRHSQSNLTKDKVDMPTDSKFNLTDSTGNVMSMRFEMDKLSIDEKAGCLDIELPLEAREAGLFNLCLLVGLNYMTGQAYVKSVFPSQAQIPPHIENLVFPETLSSASRGEWCADSKGGQCYSLVLTDERGERSYGYCRRVLPEGATACLPLCYCIIGRYRAPGFYYKVLQEIESHHGSSDVEINSILQQLFETDFPSRGEEVTVSYHHTGPSKEMVKCSTMPDMRSSAGGSDLDYYDVENNNGPRKVMLSFEGYRTKTIKRPIEPRVDEDNLSTLLDLLGAGLVIKVFGSLLLERKVIIIGDQLTAVSSCLEALQSSLYPFVWQQPLISAIPAEIQTDVLEAPLPILAGMLKTSGDIDVEGILFEEGMLIDLTHPSKVLFCQSDESTILPTSSYKTLKTSLQMESTKHKDKQEDTKTRNVMISEAFMRFFVDILDGYWRFYRDGAMKDGDMGKDGAVFDKDAFIKSATSKQNQYFLEWFTETAMFNHFAQNMATKHLHKAQGSDIDVAYVDAPLPDFYHLFDDRISNITRFNMSKNVEGKNYKSAMNRKVKMLKNKLRDLVA
ncbi:DENN domain-containing protein 2A isoform X2 [Manduca sexta]|uniref:DENN domain-containing protein 2A isoform X2 n=1 Tax=Manduca sexta TaxID=7130 RepID=UPI001183327A|nr:DENN domain-containing protein 2A isoform X2 [Manduca sexta]